jgi:UDPglucose 6-dehydrogenase
MDMAADVPFIATTVVDAQLIKYAANAFLAMRVSFINEVAAICERVGGDVRTVAAGLGYDPRIGSSYLQAGIGFGGPCLEKDLMALIQFADKAGYEPGFLREVLARNDRQVQSIVDRTAAFLGNDLGGKRIAVLGLAFKPDTNDVRTSLSVRIIRSFTELGASVVAHDPVAIEDAEALGLDVEFDHDALSAAQGAAALLVLTDWPEYQDLDWGRVAEAMAGKDVVDGRNCLDAALLADAGLVHHGIGR